MTDLTSGIPITVLCQFLSEQNIKKKIITCSIGDRKKYTI